MSATVKLNRAGIRSILRSSEAMSLVEEEANKIAQKAERNIGCRHTGKPHYGVIKQVGPVSAHAIVVTKTDHARNAERKRSPLKNSL